MPADIFRYFQILGTRRSDVLFETLIREVLEAYERVILDAMRGDHTLFTTAEGIERLWEISQHLLENSPPVRLYDQGGWGPKSIHQLIAPHMLGACRSNEPGEIRPRRDWRHCRHIQAGFISGDCQDRPQISGVSSIVQRNGWVSIKRT